MLLRDLIDNLNQIKEWYGDGIEVLMDSETLEVEATIVRVKLINNGNPEVHLMGYVLSQPL